MSFYYPNSVIHTDASAALAPFLHLFDGLDAYGAVNSCQPAKHSRVKAPRIQAPKFDIKEVGDCYELHGDFPGFDQNDITLEFSDDTTLNVRARTEKDTTVTNVDPSSTSEATTPTATEGHASNTDHQPRVEDESAELVNNDGSSVMVSTKKGNTAKASEPIVRYHARERAIGEFYRSFTFPERINQDAVTATMKNGVLSISVPKAKKPESKRIAIQ